MCMLIIFINKNIKKMTGIYDAAYGGVVCSPKPTQKHLFTRCGFFDSYYIILWTKM